MSRFLSSRVAQPVLGVLAGMALLAGAPATAAPENDEQAEAPLSKGEQRLARMLEGRVAGEPQTCIRTLPSQRITTIEGTAYIYGSGNTIYVQRTMHPESISRGDTVVVQRINGSQLCRQDPATTVDRVAGFYTGNIQFADFVPYTRVKEDDG